FAGMMLAGMGATVHRIERPGPAPALPRDNGLLRWRNFHEIDLKDPQGHARARELIGAADALYEGFRPGVMERLGLGPADCHALNPGLVYVRMTGWDQYGPYAHTAGHDINYLAVSGVLDTIGEPTGPPRAPANHEHRARS
ncbi:MAG: CoA transferase, partial [Luteitalea sp.]|nr:CoA transferase [Luteitalea sp.]